MFMDLDGLQHKYDFIFEMDADFSHNQWFRKNYTMPSFWDADLAIGLVMSWQMW
jgi:dolichol-phosphate mannosyltransferase